MMMRRKESPLKSEKREKKKKSKPPPKIQTSSKLAFSRESILSLITSVWRKSCFSESILRMMALIEVSHSTSMPERGFEKMEGQFEFG